MLVRQAFRYELAPTAAQRVALAGDGLVELPPVKQERACILTDV